MSNLVEPFFYCLILSMIWAPAVFLIAVRVAAPSSGVTKSLDGVVWPSALMIAALPALTAPVAGAFGLSLRRARDLPPMAAPTGDVVVASDAAITGGIAPNTVSFTELLWTAAVLYFYAFLMLLALAAVRHVWFSYRLHYATPVDEPQLLASLESWRKRVGVARKPRYVFSHIVNSVCVYGFFRPVVVLPFNLLDRISIDDAALMGAHEMAHVKRGDVFLFALCSVAKAVFWFNPFMHRICARAALAAEQGADALVLARGVDRRQYAQCFVQGLRLAAGARPGFAGALVPSFTPFDKRSRRARLDAILSGKAPESTLNMKSRLMLGAGAAIAAALAVAQAAVVVAPPEPKEALPVAPVEGEITFGYGKSMGHLSGDRPAHEGVDIRAARGTPVKAAGDGKVVEATNRYHGSEAWGNVVVIDHGHGLVTRYAHLDSYAVRKGDRVAAGDVIGAVGSTGKSTGPHLHFEVISEGETIDPSPVIEPAPATEARAAARMTRSLKMPAATAAPLPLAESDASPLSEKDGAKLKNKLAKLEQRIKKRFENYEPSTTFDDATLELNDLELDGEDIDAEMAELFEDHQLRLKDLAAFNVELPDLHRLVAKARLSDEDLDEIRREQKEAMREAALAIKQARKDMEEEKRERERELREDRRERERELREARREAEEARAEAEAEAVAEAEDDVENVNFLSWPKASPKHKTFANIDIEDFDEAEMLDNQEREIRKAKYELERQLAEIEERRKELENDDR
ncbi:MAG: peptidoglycan DD-metalloendopeptidase family protein [Parvularculaceae bacterium]